MTGLYNIQLIIVAIVLGIILAITDIPFGWALLILSVTIFVLLGYLIFNALFWTKSVKTTEKFLFKNQRNSMYKFYYLMANQHDKEELVEPFENILKKYKKPDQQALFETIFALYRKDLNAAKNHVANIQPDLYKNYYEASILIEERKIVEAEEKLESVQNPWMKLALRSNIDKEKGNLENARSLAKQALKETRGVNRYILYKSFTKEGLLI